MTNDALIDHPHTASCKNCGATTTGNFCHQCGQATHLHVPSAREFLHEFIAHYVALEGKLWRSLKLLLLKPGLLTREYIEGRRVRYVEPLRLYLTFSIIFFALFKMSGVEFINIDKRGSKPPAIEAPVAGAQAQPQAQKEQERKQDDTEGLGADNIKEFNKFIPGLGERIDKVVLMPSAQRDDLLKRTFYSYTPYAIFLMMPVFALFLKLLYLGSGRRYGEHFLFALHSNAFAFMMLSLFILAYMSNFVRFLLIVWLVFYLPTAMRRVYGGGRMLTALRWVILMSLHILSLGLAVFLAVTMVLVS